MPRRLPPDLLMPAFRLADEIRVMVERFISREGDWPRPGPAE
jgi:hypothetical protein